MAGRQQSQVPSAAAPALLTHPFLGPGLWPRVLPFAVVAVAAEASLALPGGTQSVPAAIVSAVLLLAVAAAFFLPWQRLPGWATVLVPIAYTGSVLALILAAGTTSGVGVVILIPLIWTALFHRRWESACVVAAIVVVEVIISLTPAAEPDSVVARRVLLWAALGALISVATHGLRDRIRRSQEESMSLQDRLRDMSVMAARERIATELRDTVIQRIFAAGLTLQSAASLTTQDEVSRRLKVTIDELDQAVLILRDAIFGLEHRLPGNGIRQEVLDLCARLSPAPEISFTGPVDGALRDGGKDQLLGMLRETLELIADHAIPDRIAITARDDSCLAVIEAGPIPSGGPAKPPSRELDSLRDKAIEAGVSVDIQPIPGGTRFAWQVPLRR